jgi:hypothetical protein
MRAALQGGRRPDGAAGFSVIEVLVAAGILLIIAIGLIPLFTQALITNKAGADSTTASQFGISRVEQLYPLDFNNAALDPATTDEYYSRHDKQWLPGTEPDDDPASWTRSTLVEQFNLSDLDDDGVFNDPLPAGTDPVFIHIKLIEVTTASARDPASPIGSRRALVLRTFKPF